MANLLLEGVEVVGELDEGRLVCRWWPPQKLFVAGGRQASLLDLVCERLTISGVRDT